MPFYVSAVPGLLIGLLILFLMKEPARGESDIQHAAAPAERKSTKANILSLAVNAPYLYATLGMAMVTFSLGGNLGMDAVVPAAQRIQPWLRRNHPGRDHRRRRPRRHSLRRLAGAAMAAHESSRALSHLRVVRLPGCATGAAVLFRAEGKRCFRRSP